MMDRLIWPISVALCLFLATGGISLAEPEDASLAEFMDLGTLLKGAPFDNLKPMEGLVPVLQDDEWGWGEDEKKGEEEAPPEEPGGGDGWGFGEEGGEKKKEDGEGWGWGDEGGGEEAEKPPASPGGGEGGGEGGEDGGWGEPGGWTDEPGGDTEPAPPTRGEIPYGGPRVSYARKTRIGIDGGLFLPLGHKKEEYDTSGIGGVFLGFGLPPFLGSLTVTSEVHIGAAFTSSTQTATGYDVSTNLILGKFDLLFHFMPNSQKFNLYYFLGLAVGYEMSTASPSSGVGADVSEGYPGFLVDTGLGAWLNLGGPVDLILKMEFNFIPMSENVPYFVTGQAGIQVKF
jgi:hypothetical protein